jgi:hypothetical protein
MVRSTQILPNKIQLEDDGMEVQIVWEETTMAPQEVMEKGAIIAP